MCKASQGRRGEIVQASWKVEGKEPSWKQGPLGPWIIIGHRVSFGAAAEEKWLHFPLDLWGQTSPSGHRWLRFWEKKVWVSLKDQREWSCGHWACEQYGLKYSSRLQMRAVEIRPEVQGQSSHSSEPGLKAISVVLQPTSFTKPSMLAYFFF